MSDAQDEQSSKHLMLSGLRVLVTRAESQSADFAERLQQLGATAVCKPLIVISPPESWQEFDAAVLQEPGYDWIVFASTNAVISTAKRFKHLNFTLDAAKTSIAAVGPATADAARNQGWNVAFQPEEFIAEALVKTFPGYPQLSNTRILWPKTNIGRLFLADQLRGAGAEVTIVNCYRTEAPAALSDIGSEIVDLIRQRTINVITLASAQTVKNLATALAVHQNSALFDGVPVVAIGPETARAFQKSFPDTPVQQAQDYSEDGIIACLCALNADKTHSV